MAGGKNAAPAVRDGASTGRGDGHRREEQSSVDRLLDSDRGNARSLLSKRFEIGARPAEEFGEERARGVEPFNHEIVHHVSVIPPAVRRPDQPWPPVAPAARWPPRRSRETGTQRRGRWRGHGL